MVGRQIGKGHRRRFGPCTGALRDRDHLSQGDFVIGAAIQHGGCIVKVQDVTARATIQLVGAPHAHERVVACAAVNHVIARTSIQQVIGVVTN